MKVALLNDSFPPVVDGVANVVLNYAKNLPGQGHRPFVATPWYPNAADDYDFPVIRYRSYNAKNTGYRAGNPFSPSLLRRLETAAPDIIHSHCPIVSTILARLLRERLRVPLIITYHTKFDVDVRNAVKGKLLQEASLWAIVDNISACDEVWTVSRGAADNLKSLGYKGEVRVMENGVDFPKGPAPKEAVEALSRRYDLAPQMPVFLYVGRLMWYKGFRLTLDALHEAARRGLDYRFLVVGDGVDGDEIRAYAEELGLGERCRFLGMVRDREQLRALYSRANLFLFPSTFDTNGIVVREAAACECPSLLLAGSCAAEGITHRRNGLLTGESVREVAEQLCFAGEHLPLLQELGQKAGEEIYLSWQDAVARAARRYEEVQSLYRALPPTRGPELNEGMYALAAATLSRIGKIKLKNEK